MMSNEVDQIVAELQANVASRRAAGDYPPGLEEQLEAFFSQMLRSLHDTQSVTDQLSHQIDRVGRALATLDADVGTTSRVPGGSIVHSTTSAVIRRHTQHVVGQVGELGDAIFGALAEVRRLMEQQQLSDNRETTLLLASVMDRLAVVDHLAAMITDLEQRLCRLERGRD
jgi:hypothetical protein